MNRGLSFRPARKSLLRVRISRTSTGILRRKNLFDCLFDCFLKLVFQCGLGLIPTCGLNRALIPDVDLCLGSISAPPVRSFPNSRMQERKDESANASPRVGTLRRIQMEENHKMPEQESSESSPVRTWLIVAVCLCFITTAIALGYGVHQQSTVSQLAAKNQEMKITMSDMHSQMGALNERLNDVSSQAAAAVSALQQQQMQESKNGKNVSAQQRAANARQLKQLQSTLTDQQKQLKDTQDLVAKNRTDLEGALGSTKDELNGSIARTHDELWLCKNEASAIILNSTSQKPNRSTGTVQSPFRCAEPIRSIRTTT